MQLLIITYHIDMYIIIIIMPNNKIIDLIVSLLTAAYSIGRIHKNEQLLDLALTGLLLESSQL